MKENENEIIVLPLADNTAVSLQQIKAFNDTIILKIEDCKGRKKRNKISATIMQTFSVIFSFSTTVLIGWKTFDKSGSTSPDLLNWALVISALASGLSTLIKYYDNKDLWVVYKIAAASLESLSEKLMYLSSRGEGKTTKKELDDEYKKYETICEDMSKNYQQIRSSES
jgi:hypothetical protein